MARVLDLHNLMLTPENQRNGDWEAAFFQALVEGRLKVDPVEPQPGPDGWPYLLVQTSPAASEPAVKILDWLSTRGIGMVVNATKMPPDYVFTYGMIWNWRERGEFVTASTVIENAPIEFSEGEKVLAGAPTKQYLPDYARSVLDQFFASQGISDPRILVISKDQKHFDLCFSLESLGDPPEHERAGIAEAIAWFMPPHYSIVLISEKGLPNFSNLKVG